MEELMNLLTALKPEIDFERETELIDDGLLESFDVITLIAEIEDQFGIEVPAEEIMPENFNSAKDMWRLLEQLKGEDA
ncbi:MAG: acyl carrier protein [Lachnospiraceae bacterium]|nr:acyl carrier protein [Lachnospiraceae bacterium]MCI9656990.1 acyl carrier protein [Lachnospiraceae bacterium]